MQRHGAGVNSRGRSIKSGLTEKPHHNHTHCRATPQHLWKAALRKLADFTKPQLFFSFLNKQPQLKTHIQTHRASHLNASFKIARWRTRCNDIAISLSIPVSNIASKYYVWFFFILKSLYSRNFLETRVDFQLLFDTVDMTLRSLNIKMSSSCKQETPSTQQSNNSVGL